MKYWAKAMSSKVEDIRKYSFTGDNRLFLDTNVWIYIHYGTPDIPDIRLGLTVKFPNGTLVVDDPIEISGKAILSSPRSRSLVPLEVAYQNAMLYPVSQDADGLTSGAGLIFKKTQNSSVWEAKTVSMVWTQEGNYYPMVLAVLLNTTHSPPFEVYIGISPEVAMTVGPRSQISQSVTNTAMLYLTIALLLLAFVGSIPTFSVLWNKNQPQKDDSSKHNKTKNKTYINNYMPHFRIRCHANQSTHYHYRTRYKK
jgi:hypothetical protein